jgi:AcrR family transcriptional regulator
MKRRMKHVPRRRPLARTQVEIVEAIVRAANEIIAERGLDGLTTNHVAERAGVSIGSLYRYFPGKEAIVAELDLRYRQRAAAELLDALDAYSVDLASSLERGIRQFLEPPPELRALRRALIHSVPLSWVERSSQEIWDRVTTDATAALCRVATHLSPEEARHRIAVALHAVQGVAIGSVMWAPTELAPERAASSLARMLVPFLVGR